MKKKMVILLIMILFLTSGCGANGYLQDDDKKIVQYAETGQNLPNNILCKPESGTDLYKLYEEYSDDLKIPFDKLPSCEDFKLNSNKASGLWELIFVKPLAYLILKLGNLVGNMGVSVILIGLLIRLILLPFSYKNHKQSKNMQKVQRDLQKLEYKYRGREDRDSMMMKSQEMMEIYKKYDVKPMGGCLVAFLQLPLFFAFLQAINRVPSIFEGKLLGFNLGMTPYVGLSHGNYSYIILIILIAVTTYFSFKYSMNATAQMSNQSEDMKKQTNIMTIIMVIMITMTSFSLPTALAFYWITTYAFITAQTYLFRVLSGDTKRKDKTKSKENKNKKIKEKLEVKRG